ncbi:ADP-ribose pyrophosphatase [Hyaloraphidium curvatum]|nr:ADP-ribose pyrophosphatase [Hyaloraphidium curvatum]
MAAPAGTAAPAQRPAARNSHCTFCGNPWPDPRAAFPRNCTGCSSTSYSNPLPVALCMVPVEESGPEGAASPQRTGLLLIRRGITPGKGLLAFPGGFVETGETWQQGAARECFEETGLAVNPEQLRIQTLTSILDSPVLSHLLIFSIAPPIRASALPPFEESREVTERTVAYERLPKETFAFPAHWDVFNAWFEARDERIGPGKM